MFSNFHLAACYIFSMTKLAQHNDSIWSCSQHGLLVRHDLIRARNDRCGRDKWETLDFSLTCTEFLCPFEPWKYMNPNCIWMVYRWSPFAASSQVTTWQVLFTPPDFSQSSLVTSVGSFWDFVDGKQVATVSLGSITGMACQDKSLLAWWGFKESF